MTITIKQLSIESTRILAGALTLGEEIHPAIEQLAAAHEVRFGRIDLLGGLTEMVVRSFDFETRARKEPLVYHGALEITGGHGTISLLDGQPQLHMHLSAAVPDPISPGQTRIGGGHIEHAVAHAVEFIITAYDGDPIRRKPDRETGLSLWDLPVLQ